MMVFYVHPYGGYIDVTRIGNHNGIFMPDIFIIKLCLRNPSAEDISCMAKDKEGRVLVLMVGMALVILFWIGST